MKRKFLLTLAIAATTAVVFNSCEKDNDKPGAYENGALVLNEGSFMQSNASVSWVSYNSDSVVNNLFERVNGRPLGDVLQSALKSKGKIYLVLNNSGKVEIVNSSDFVQAGVIERLNNPRYITSADDKLYVTQWNGWGQKGAVLVFNQSNLSKVDSIPVGTGAEGIAYVAGRIFVANSGGFGLDSSVSVINPTTKQVETIQVGYCPKEMVVDANGKLWVICSGADIYDANWNIVATKPSSLVVINPSTKNVEKTIPLFNDKHPSHIDISPNGQTVYYGGGFGFNGIYSLALTATANAQQPLIQGFFYGFNVNPQNGDIYCLEAPSFTSGGTLKVFANGSYANPSKTVTVGIGPNGVLFN